MSLMRAGGRGCKQENEVKREKEKVLGGGGVCVKAYVFKTYAFFFLCFWEYLLKRYGRWKEEIKARKNRAVCFLCLSIRRKSTGRVFVQREE